jgi:transcriptional regulator with PAS, ATPase and Fis domain
MIRFSRFRRGDHSDLIASITKGFLAHSWPGNVGELENLIDHAIIIAKQDKILIRDLPQFLLQRPLPTQELTSLRDYEKTLF